MQLNSLSDFDLFVLQFYFIELEIHSDVHKDPGLFTLSPMRYAHCGADRHAALTCITRSYTSCASCKLVAIHTTIVKQ